MQLETARLLLREYVEGDWSGVLAYSRDPHYEPEFAGEPWTEPRARDFVNQFLSDLNDERRSRFQLAIELKQEGRLIGGCGLRLRRPVSFGEAEVEEGDIGYELDPSYRGCGLATEAAAALLDFGFDECHLHRIWAYCLEQNTASIHVLERLGMTREAHLRENALLNGKRRDSLIYAILADEWRARGLDTAT